MSSDPDRFDVVYYKTIIIDQGTKSNYKKKKKRVDILKFDNNSFYTILYYCILLIILLLSPFLLIYAFIPHKWAQLLWVLILCTAVYVSPYTPSQYALIPPSNNLFSQFFSILSLPRITYTILTIISSFLLFLLASTERMYHHFIKSHSLISAHGGDVYYNFKLENSYQK